MSYAFIDPEPAEGVFFCPRCLCDQLFETDPGMEKDLDKPLFCCVCSVQIDATYEIMQIHPYPEVRTKRPALTSKQREEGRLKLMRLRTAPPIEEPTPLPLDDAEAAMKAQMAQLSRGMR
ncbi:hypothetical protein [uncultured Zoogloea sp.]|jgi:hypothetical protein|uniref:hypothetical protein n=1 Tax=uncultured Zoogloea sp. TaxID=160237 RepID=UPI0026088CE0|nr:hypothetical protein [uncultured Zoogloea sp.]